MDGTHFDDLTRTLAHRSDRRALLRALGTGIVGGAMALVGGRAEAHHQPTHCIGDGSACGRDAKGCCSGSCCGGLCCGGEERCTEAGCCPLAQTCGDVCCPPEAVGCTETKLPDGSVIVGCSCGENSVIRDGHCVDCGWDTTACGDTCCPRNAVCRDGVCELCPADSCWIHTGVAICGAYSTEDICCPDPYWAACCCESSPGAGDGWAGCCILSGPNADCPPCVYAPENTHFAGGAGTCSCTPETFPECCYCGSEGGWGKIECSAG